MLMSINRHSSICIIQILLLSLIAESAITAAQDTAPIPEVVITATRIEREVFETPQGVTVIGDEAVAQANVPSTPDLFQFAQGVYMQKTNLGGGSPFIRGLTGKQVLILIDGVRLNNSFYRFGPHQYLNTIDPNIIERIEVVRGPSSVLYGTDALGGVINVITKRRTEFPNAFDLDGVLEGMYDSSLDGGSGRVQVEGNRRDVGWIGGVTGKSYGDIEAGGGLGEQEPSGYDEVDADLKFNWRLDTRQELILATQYTRQYDVPKTSEVTLGDKLKFNYEPQRRVLTYAEYRARALGLFDQFSVNVSFNHQEEGEEIIEEDAPTSQTQELTGVDTVGMGLQMTNRLGSHRFTYGLDYYHDRYDTAKASVDLLTGMETQLIPGSPDDASYASLGAYVQDELRLHPRAELVLGVRYSAFETEGEVGEESLSLDASKFTGSLHGLIKLTPRWNLVSGVAQGFRAPNMEDFFGRVDFFNEIPNTALEPEESLSWDLGLKYYTQDTTGELYYYLSDYDGLIERVTVGTQPDGSPIKQRRNIKDARIQGVEAAFTHTFNRHWTTAATVGWTEGEDRDTGEPLRRIPPVNGSLRVRYTYNPDLWTELSGLLADKQDELSPEDIDDPRIPSGGTPGYGVVNLKLGYQRTRNERLLVTLQNLDDKPYKTHGSGLFAPGRSVVLSYRVQFN